MAAGDITAETFSNRKVCLARAREHLSNRLFESAAKTLSRGLRQWADADLDHNWLTLSGHVALKRGEFKKARRQLSLAIRDEDSHSEAKYLLGNALIALGKYDRAIEVFEQLLGDDKELVPYRVHAGSALSVAYAALGLNKSSQDVLEVAASFDLVSAQLLADEGFRLMRIGAYAEAEVQLAKALQIDPTCEDAFARLANTLMITGKTEPALEVLAYGIEQSQEATIFYRLMAEVYTTRTQHAEASAFIKRAMEISPEADHIPDLRFMLADSLYSAGRTEAAKVVFKTLVDDFPRAEISVNAGHRLNALENADPDAPVSRMQSFPCKLQKRAYCAPNTMANVLAYLGVETSQEEVAARVFRDAGSHWPDIFDYLEGVEGIAFRGYFGSLDLLKKCVAAEIPVITTEHYGQQGHAIAITGYDDVGQLFFAQDPRFIEPAKIPYAEFQPAWLHDDGLCIAIVREADKSKLPAQGGDHERLVRSYLEILRARLDGKTEDAARKAAELSDEAPEKQAPLRILAEISLETRATDQLKVFCEEALKKWPKCFWARRHLGDALWMQDDALGALREYRRARQIDKRDKALSYALGELFLATGNNTHGMAFLMHALAEDPTFHAARLRLARAYKTNRDTEKATYHARLLVEYEPDNTDYREFLALLTGNTAVIAYADAAKQIQQRVAAKTAKAEAEAEAARNNPEPDEMDETEEWEIEMDE
ncbi:MAG: tetratricopeptide repeat protein [Planctomycetota bacterium]|jgi:tetratricopeptide (TPR) repeat protein